MIDVRRRLAEFRLAPLFSVEFVAVGVQNAVARVTRCGRRARRRNYHLAAASGEFPSSFAPANATFRCLIREFCEPRLEEIAMFMGNRVGIGAVTAALASFGISVDTRADVQTAIYLAPEAFSYKIRHMPDLDQRRLLLPGQGAMYCVPTGTMNLLAYAADHGFASLSPGDRNWQLAENYNDMTNFIYDLGEIMDTDEVNGTGSPYGATYVWMLLNQAPLVVTHYHKTDSWIPKIQNLVKTAVQNQSVVAFAYGRYRLLSELPGFITVGNRASGHMVTLSEAQRFGSDIRIGVRDPADEAQNGLYLLTQSPFMTRVFNNVQERLVFFDDGTFATSTLLQFPISGTNVAIIDSYLAIRPMQGYGWSPGGIIIVPAFAGFLGGAGGSNPEPQNITFEAQSLLVDAILAPEGDASYVLLGAADGVQETLACVDHTDGTLKTINNYAGASQLVSGRNRELYIMQPEIISCVDVDGVEPAEISSAFVPVPPRGMAYNDATDQLLVLLPLTNQIALYRQGLPDGVGPTMVNIPMNIPMEGDGSIAVNPADGLIAFATQTSHSIYTVNLNGPAGVHVEEIALPEITEPTGLSFSDQGDLFAKTADGVVQLRRNPLNGQWQLVEEPLFGDLAMQLNDFQVTCSRTNYDPIIHSGPGYNNFEPSENDELFSADTFVLDCNADLNGDGVVNGADLAALLAAWGSCDICLADVNGDRVINGTDLANLLSAFGPCPVLE